MTPNTLLLSLHSRILVLQDLCLGRTGIDALQTGIKEGEVRLKVVPVSEKEDNGIPRHERSISIAKLDADEELLVLLDAADLIDVAVDSVGELLRVSEGEPHGLPKLRCLAGHLVI